MIAGELEIKLFANIAQLQSSMNKAEKSVDSAMRNIDKSVALANRAFRGLAAFVSVAAIAKLSDEYKQFDSQLQLSTKNLNTYVEAYSNVLRISKLAQSDIKAVGVFYSRVNNNLRDFNVTQKEVAGITETVALALRTNNATVQETSSVMLQLSQSFGSGRLNGQEFLAVAEGAPMLLRQLAKSMDKPFGALKDLSAQGKITREELLKAFNDPEYLDALRNQVKQVGTINSAMTVLTNNLKVFIGEQDKATGASAAYRKIILLIAENIDKLATVGLVLLIIQVGKVTAGVYANIVAMQARQMAMIKEQVILQRNTALEAANTAAKVANARATYGAAAAASVFNKASSTKAMAEGVALQTAMAARMTITAQAAGLLRGAIAALGGPIGAVITILGLGATAWMAWGKDGATSADDIAAALKRVKDGLESIGDAKNISKALSEANVELQRLQKPLTVWEKLSSSSVEAAEEVKRVQIAKTQKSILELEAGLAKHNQTQKENSVIVNEGDKAYEELAKARKLATVQIAEEEAWIKKAALALKYGRIEQEEYNRVVFDSNEKIKQLKEAKTKLTVAEKEAYKMSEELAKIYYDVLKAGSELNDLELSSIQTIEKKMNSISGLQEETRKYLETQIELAKASEFEKVQNEAIDREIENFNELYNAEKESTDKRYENYVEMAERIKRENEDLTVALMTNDKRRAEEQARLEHERAIEKINSMGFEGAQIEELMRLEDERYKLQKSQMIGVRSITRELGMTFTSAFEDAIASGKKLSDVINSLAQDMLKLITRRMITEPLMNAVAGSMDSWFPSLGGSGGVSATAGAYSIDNNPFLNNTFANGGIMSSGGSLPLNKYAKGGIATGPQMALFGEGRMNEAYVPLPDGRSIPVSMNGGGSNVSVVINNNSDAQATAQETTDARGNRRIEVTIGDMVASEIRRNGSDAFQSIRNTFSTRPKLVGR
jgi:tape measure domain-containing protein